MVVPVAGGGQRQHKEGLFPILGVEFGTAVVAVGQRYCNLPMIDDPKSH